MTDNGLYGKYLIYPVEAQDQFDQFLPIEDAFVLRPAKDDAAKRALAAYADSTDDVELSRDLWRWLASVERPTRSVGSVEP
jgi:hypothetical protein